MNEIQLPKFQPHPECAAGIITVDQAIAMMERGWLTYEGAVYLLPMKAWPLLPQPEATPLTSTPKTWWTAIAQRWQQR